MSVTTVALEDRKTKITAKGPDGKDVTNHVPKAYVMPAMGVKAEDYSHLPAVEVTVNKEKVKVPQVEFLASSLTKRVYETRQDVETAAGDRFDGWVVSSANTQEEEAVLSGARDRIKTAKTLPAVITELFAGLLESINIFAEKEKKGGRVALKEQAAKALEQYEGDVEAQLAAMKRLLGIV